MSHPLFDLSGRVALVTGAGGGFGRAIAVGFAESGADLMLADINPETLQASARQVETIGRKVETLICDVTVPEQIRTLYEKLDEAFGKIDVLVNVAGPAWTTTPETISLDDVSKTMNALGVARFYCCQQAGQRMLGRGRGSIINIGSIASVTAMGRGHIAYSMGMGAVAQMTRELSTEWSGRGVRVNAILPAQVPNPGNNLENRMKGDPALRRNFLRGLPIGRLGRPEDIVGPAIFLASDASAWVTGILLPMDGGNLAKNAGGSHPGMPEPTASL